MCELRPQTKWDSNQIMKTRTLSERHGDLLGQGWLKLGTIMRMPS